MNITKSLSENILLSEKEFISYVKTAPFRYKKYKIRKRNKKEYRQIAQPAKAVKKLQRQAVEILRHKLPIHESAYAYEIGKGIKANAQSHVKNEYLLKIDFKDFFNSITPEVFFGL